MTTEILTSDDDPMRPERPPHRPLRSALSRSAILGTAASVVLAGGLVTAAYRTIGNETAAERLVPAGAFGFSSVNLDLSAGQAAAADAFAAHFPDSPTKRGSGSFRDRVLRALLADSEDPHVDYDKDVKPWLGDRAAIAGWVDSAGHPQVEAVLATTDAASARTHLQHVLTGQHAGLAFRDGYAVLGASQATVDEALRAADTSSLADSSSYRGDMSHVASGAVATGWLDGPRAAKLIQDAFDRAMHDDSGAMAVPGSDSGSGFSSTITLTPDGASSGAVGAASSAPMGESYSDSTGMAAVGSVSSAVGLGAASVFGPLSGALLAGAVPAAGGAGPASGLADLGRLTAALRVSDNYVELDARSTASKGGAGSSTALLTGLPADTTAALQVGDSSMFVDQLWKGISQFGGDGSDGGDVFGRLHDATGLYLPGDLEKLLGHNAVLSLGSFNLLGGGIPDVALRSQPTDMAAARGVVDTLNERFSNELGRSLDVSTAGSDLVVATTHDYGQRVAAAGALGKQSRFTTALGDLPDRVQSAAYVDLSRILPVAPGVPADLRKLAAIGAWSSRDGDATTSQLRLVVS